MNRNRFGVGCTAVRVKMRFPRISCRESRQLTHSMLNVIFESVPPELGSAPGAEKG